MFFFLVSIVLYFCCHRNWLVLSIYSFVIFGIFFICSYFFFHLRMDVNMRFDFSNYWYGNEVNKFFFYSFFFHLLQVFWNAHVFFCSLCSQYTLSLMHLNMNVLYGRDSPLQLFFFISENAWTHVKIYKLTWIKRCIVQPSTSS